MKQLNNLKRNLVALLKHHKIKNNIAYYKQAKKIGVNEREIHRWLNGRHYPSTKNMLKIINHYDVGFHSFTDLTTKRFYDYELSNQQGDGYGR